MLYHDDNAIYLFADGHPLADPQDSYRYDQTGGRLEDILLFFAVRHRDSAEMENGN